MNQVRSLISFLFIGLTAYGSVRAQADDQIHRTREFVVMGYHGIQMDLGSGKGPYLRTLNDLLRTPAEAEGKITDQLKTLLKTYPNIMDFADQVVLLVASSSASTPVASMKMPLPSGPGVFSGEKLLSALEHLTRGMEITVYLKTGEQLKGMFAEYSARRLWVRGAARRSVFLDDILALEAPQL